MAKQHPLKLIISSSPSPSDCVEIVDFTDSKGRPAVDYGSTPGDPVSTGHTILFKSAQPFLLRPDNSGDWDYSGLTHGAVWEDTVSHSWTAILAAQSSSTQFVLELRIAKPVPAGQQDTIAYRIVGMNPDNLSKASIEKQTAKAMKVICAKRKQKINAAAGGKSTIIITN